MRVHGRGGAGGGTPTGWPLTWFSHADLTSNGMQPSAPGGTLLRGFELAAQLSAGNIVVSVSAADGVNLADVGIYSAAGALQAHTGAVTWGSAAVVAVAFVGGAVIFNPGRYLFAMTHDASSTMTLQFDGTHLCWFSSDNYVAAPGGVLPASITAPTLSAAKGNASFGLY